MGSTFLSFETAKKSIMASQSALNITGNNVSNINTTGYTRQRVDLFSVVTPTSGGLYRGNNLSNAGQGVYAAGVQQIRDPFLDTKYRELNSQTAESAAKTGILTDVENILDNIDSDGMRKLIQNFQKTLSSYATNSADSKEIASVVRQNATQIVNMFNSYGSKLSDLYDQTKSEITSTVSGVNATLAKIADLNDRIADAYVSANQISPSLVADYTVDATYGPNELLDARNVLIDSLSTYGDVEVLAQNDGTVTIKMSGDVAVEGKKYNELSCIDDTKTGAMTLRFSSGADYDPESGSLKGYLEVFNGNGCYAEGSQTGSLGIPYFRSVINEFARTFADAFNTANVDSADPDVARDMFVSSDGTLITAENIRISDEWYNDPMALIPQSQDGSLDNEHLLKLTSVFSKDLVFGDKSDFTGTLEEYVSYYSNKLGSEIEYESGRYTASNSLTDSVLSQRDSISGVSLDEEGINMMNYQKWFNASSRMMTTLDEELDTIINSMGLVGR